MRKTIELTISEPGRDHGKRFLLTEMPALQAERWATKAILVLAKSGVDIPPNLLKGGMATFAVLGIQALVRVDYEAAEPLILEILQCVQIMESAVTRKLTQDDIEEVSTLINLRVEVLKLHLGFSTGVSA